MEKDISNKESFTRDEVIALLEDLYAKTAEAYNDYGKHSEHYEKFAVAEIAKYMKTGNIQEY